MKHSIPFTLSLIATSTIAAAAEGPALPAPLAQIADAASTAQRRCHEFMHEDADEFVSCIDALAAAIHRGEQFAQQKKLGIIYFGWVAANNSARLSLPGADSAAARYRAASQKLQQKLHLSDAALCPVVAGDCTVRLAQLRAASQARSTK